MFQWLYNKVWKDSWSGLLGAIKVAVGGGLLSVHYLFTSLGPVLNDSSVKTAFASMNFPPHIGLIFAVLGALTLLSVEH